MVNPKGISLFVIYLL